MRNNSVGNRPEAIVQSIASKICVMVGHYSPQTHLILVLKRDALGLSLLLHHGGTLLSCLRRKEQQVKNAGDRCDGWCGRRACETLVEAAKGVVMGS